MVVQRYLRRAPAPAAVLVASAPPHGLLHSAIAMALREPLLLHQISALVAFGLDAVTPDHVARALFSPRMPAEEIHRHLPRFDFLCESQRVLLEMSAPQPPAWLYDANTRCW